MQHADRHWLKRLFASLMVVFALGLIGSPAASAAPNEAAPTNICGQTDLNKSIVNRMNNDKLLPVQRWSSATNSIHTRLDGKAWADLPQKAQRSMVDSSMMSLGNAEFSASTQILEMAAAFCPSNEAAVKVDNASANMAHTLLGTDSNGRPGPWGYFWVAAVAVGIVISGLVEAARSGRFPWNRILRFTGILGILTVMLNGASSSSGSTFGTMSPGWFISRISATVDDVSSGMSFNMSNTANALGGEDQKKIAQWNKASCVNYTNNLVNTYRNKYQPIGPGAANADSRLPQMAALPISMNDMWMLTGLRAYTETQYGVNNAYGWQVNCRGLEWLSGIPATEQNQISQGHVGFNSAGSGLNENNNASPGAAPKGMVAIGGAKNPDKSFFFGLQADNNQRWDTDIIAAASCANVDGKNKWVVMPGWEAVHNGDSDHKEASAEQCRMFYDGELKGFGKETGNDTYANWQDGRGTLSRNDGDTNNKPATPPDGSVDVDASKVGAPKEAFVAAGGANPRNFISTLHGTGGMGSSMAAMLYPVTGLVMLVVYGGLGLFIFAAKYALLLAMVALFFVLLWSLATNRWDLLIRFAKGVLGIAFIAVGYNLILGIINSLTQLFISMAGASGVGSTGLGSVIWVALSPLFAIALFGWLWKKVVKAPNPLSLKSGGAYVRQAANGNFGNAVGGTLERFSTSALAGAAGGMVARRMGLGGRGGNGQGAYGGATPGGYGGAATLGTPKGQRQGGMVPAGSDVAGAGQDSSAISLVKGDKGAAGAGDDAMAAAGLGSSAAAAASENAEGAGLHGGALAAMAGKRAMGAGASRGAMARRGQRIQRELNRAAFADAMATAKSSENDGLIASARRGAGVAAGAVGAAGSRAVNSKIGSALHLDHAAAEARAGLGAMRSQMGDKIGKSAAGVAGAAALGHARRAGGAVANSAVGKGVMGFDRAVTRGANAMGASAAARLKGTQMGARMANAWAEYKTAPTHRKLGTAAKWAAMGGVGAAAASAMPAAVLVAGGYGAVKAAKAARGTAEYIGGANARRARDMRVAQEYDGLVSKANEAASGKAEQPVPTQRKNTQGNDATSDTPSVGSNTSAGANPADAGASPDRVGQMAAPVGGPANDVPDNELVDGQQQMAFGRDLEGEQTLTEPSNTPDVIDGQDLMDFGAMSGGGTGQASTPQPREHGGNSQTPPLGSAPAGPVDHTQPIGPSDTRPMPTTGSGSSAVSTPTERSGASMDAAPSAPEPTTPPQGDDHVAPQNAEPTTPPQGNDREAAAPQQEPAPAERPQQSQPQGRDVAPERPEATPQPDAPELGGANRPASAPETPAEPARREEKDTPRDKRGQGRNIMGSKEAPADPFGRGEDPI